MHAEACPRRCPLSLGGDIGWEDDWQLVLSWELSNSSESSHDICLFSRSRDKLVARCFAVPLPRKEIFAEGSIWVAGAQSVPLKLMRDCPSTYIS